MSAHNIKKSNILVKIAYLEQFANIQVLLFNSYDNLERFE